ncbi:MAG TPA: hypothetical protein VN721_16885 [Flavipsychrobacter sp.]|nr:hypothetical protein [Flavipsychrobacter sp.]
MRLFNIIFILLVFASSQSFAQTPVEYNNKLADVIVNLYNKGQAWGNKLAELDTTSKDYAKLTPIRKNIEHYIDSEIIVVKKMKDVAGSEKYREAIVTFLKSESDMIKKAFIPFEKLNSASTDTEVKTVIDGLTAASKGEAEHLQAVTAAQKEYADKNGFKIEVPASN